MVFRSHHCDRADVVKKNNHAEHAHRTHKWEIIKITQTISMKHDTYINRKFERKTEKLFFSASS